MLKPFTFAILTLLTLSCHPPQAPFKSCYLSLSINGTNEEFCTDPTIELKSQLITVDSLYIDFGKPNNYEYKSSDNFLAYSISFANTKPKSSDYESEKAFYSELLDLIGPGSLHDFNISEKGGFAVEVWDRDGIYFSTELGPQTNNAQIEITRVNLNIAEENFEPYFSYMIAHLRNTEPILLWNQEMTKSLELEFNEGQHAYITFEEFR